MSEASQIMLQLMMPSEAKTTVFFCGTLYIYVLQTKFYIMKILKD